MTAPMQPDPLDAPDWLVELIGEHIQTWEGHGAVRSGCSCGIWHASFVVVPEPYSPLYKDVAIKHRAHVAAVVWRALTERVGLEIKEGQMRAISRDADNSIGYQMDTEYRLTSLPEVDEMCPNCVTPWKCNGPHLIDGDNDD